MKPRTNSLLVWSFIFTVFGLAFYYIYSMIVPILDLPNLLGSFSTVDLNNIPFILYGDTFAHLDTLFQPPYLYRVIIMGVGALFFLGSFVFGIIARRARFFVHSILGLVPLAYILFATTFIIFWAPPDAPVDGSGNPYNILQFIILNSDPGVDLFQKVIFGGVLACAALVLLFMLLLMILNLVAFFKALKKNKEKKLEKQNAKKDAEAASNEKKEEKAEVKEQRILLF